MRKTIAIIDDEPDIVELVSLHLEKAGFNTKGFLNSERHLERIADHATNIAEDVVYLVKGKTIKHHFE